MKSLPLIPALFGLAVIAFAAAAGAEQPASLKLQYTGYLVDSPVLDARIEVARPPEGGPYRMSLSTGLIGALGDMVPFHFKASSLGRDEEVGLQPSSYRSETSIYDNRQSVALSYGPDGNVTLTDDPPTEEGQEAVAQGGLAGTIDPLTAALAIVVKVSERGSCTGKFRIFDGARRYALSLSPGPEGVATPRLPVAPKAKAMACDAAVDLVSGFPQYAINAGMYPTTARFWLARGIAGSAPVLLRLEAESGLGQMHVDLRAVLP
jgi:hypothetical protein